MLYFNIALSSHPKMLPKYKPSNQADENNSPFAIVSAN
mgnify:CR=1 FL=1